MVAGWQQELIQCDNRQAQATGEKLVEVLLMGNSCPQLATVLNRQKLVSLGFNIVVISTEVSSGLK
jgi:hypothetical protein